MNSQDWALLLSGVTAILAFLAVREQREHEKKRLTFELFAQVLVAEQAALASLDAMDFTLLEAADWSRANESPTLQQVLRYFNELDTFAVAAEEGVLNLRLARQLTMHLGRVVPPYRQTMHAIEDVFDSREILAAAHRLLDYQWKTLPEPRRLEFEQAYSHSLSLADISREAMTAEERRHYQPFPLAE